MPRKIIAFLACCGLLMAIGTKKVIATHAAGADITFTCVSGLTYKVRATFYRDCAGIAEPNTITIAYRSTSCNYNLTATASKVAGTGAEITQPCPQNPTSCNGGTSTGLRKFEYEATITLPAACTDWVFSYEVCCRNCAITTIQNPCANTSKLYIEATLNNVAASCNSSPTFSNMPIAFVCVGQNFNYNHGVLDPNNDSLVYELITPKISSTATVTWIPPHSTTQPILSSTSFTINTVTGDLNFTPTISEIGILSVRVKEYRNGVHIGSVIRDMQVYSVACTNSLPSVTGINGTGSFTAIACPNDSICFDIYATDVDSIQLVSMTKNAGIPGSTFTITWGSRPVGHFCWVPTASNISTLPHSFTITVQDNACPFNGIQAFSFNIYVPGPAYSVSSTNVTCFGLNNGTATATPSLPGSYSYTWNTSPVQTNATATGLTPGNYSITVTDGNGCDITKSVSITEPAGHTLSTTKTDLLCNAVCTGAINLTVSGGLPPFTYQWSSGQTTEDRSALCAGTYTVTVTQSNGCTKTTSVTITQPSVLTATISSQSNVTCFGLSNGSINFTPGGGVSPYTFLWNNGATTEDISGIASGTYIVTVTDANGCTKTASTNISQPFAALAVSVTSQTNVNCFGNATGAINITASGGTSPYTYAWNNGTTTEDLNSISSGNYTVTVTDNKGCTTTQSVTITQPAASLSSSITSSSPVSCFSGNNGSMNLTVSGGTSPYNYLWNTGATVEDPSSMPAGTYTVTVTDNKGCTSSTSGTITQPAAALSASAASTTNVLCFGNSTGAINLSASGGTSPYTYLWSNGATTEDISSLSSGTYTVSVTDNKGCTYSTSVNITQPAAVLDADVATQTNVNCFGNSTGAVTLNITGGTSPYVYNWSNGATAQNISGLASGTYTVTVTDNNGCTNSVSTSITQPAAALSSSLTSQTNVGCFGNSTGSIDLSVSGGTPSYTYNWSNGAITQDITNLSSGTYTVIITDNKGCTTTRTATITQPAAALSSSILSTVNVNCFGNSTGSVDLDANGGTPPYQYAWNTGATTQDISSIPAGTYSVTITDANGCTTTNNATITQPAAALSSSVSSQTNVNCFGNSTGNVNLNTSGGTPSYSYNWSNGATTQNISNLNAGTYSVTVTDSKGCTTTTSAVITQPAAMLSSSVNAQTNVGCFGNSTGSIDLSVSGGTPSYTYNWSNGAVTQDISNLVSGTYTVTVTDSKGCTSVISATITQPAAALSSAINSSSNVNCFGNSTGSVDLTVNGGTPPYQYAWNNGATTQDIINIPSGTYTVAVTDNQGCTTSTTITITQPAAALAASIASQTNVDCFGNNSGAVMLNVNGGTSPYAYLWSNGSTVKDQSNLLSGTYSVTITDNKGCTASASATVSQPAAALSSSSSSSNALCFNSATGSVNLSVNGGTSPYSYQWSNGATTQDILSLPAGSYTVTVTDSNGCTTQHSTSVSQPPVISLQFTSTNSTCGNANGSLTVNPSGGTGAFSYQWSSGSTASTISNVSAGQYTVTVTDANNCTSASTSSVNNTDGPILAVDQQTNVNCFGDNTGSLSVIVTGGTQPISYQWSNGATTPNLTNIPSGTYVLTIIDANNCQNFVTAIVTQPSAALSASVSSLANVDCFGNSTGSIDLYASGGTAPYAYQWSTGSTSEDISGMTSGNYTVTVTDANGCTSVLSTTISQPAAVLQADINATTHVDCNGNSSGSIDIIVYGGTTAYQYLWSNGATTEDLSGIPSGTYSLTVTDANSCVTNVSATITQPAAVLNSSVSSQSDVDCFGNSSGNIDISVSGGTNPYTYSWSNGTTSQDLSGIPSGTYSVLVTDVNGCTSSLSATISQPAQTLVSSVSSQGNVGCYADSSGNIDLTVSGGTSPYIYSWSNGETTEDINSLPSGSYSVLVTDINGCTSISYATIFQPSAALSAAISSQTDVDCYSNSTGSIDITVQGGTAPYQFAWSNGSTTEDLAAIASGTYSVTITDANNCITNASATITQPSAVLSSLLTSQVDVDCFGNNNGSIDITVTGGTNPYTYSWDNGATSEDITNIPAGTYSVLITDANGCTSALSVTINQPAQTIASSLNAQGNVGCFADSTGYIDLTVSGGTTPYTYVWSNGETTEDINSLPSGNYNVVVTDMNGCTTSSSAFISQPAASLSAALSSQTDVDCYSNATGSIDVTVSGGTQPYTYVWNNGATTEDISGITSGSYSVQVTDSNGCTTTLSAVISQPAATLASQVSSQINVGCYADSSGSIDLTVSGGTMPYTYSWNNGATSEDLTGLPVGTYSVLVTDSNGCTSTATVNIQQPSGALSLNVISMVQVKCFADSTGSIDIFAAGGTAPYTYSWSNGSTTEDISSLPSGSYTVLITDANGCTAAQTVTITQPVATLASTISFQTNIDCFGNSVGSINITVTGGTAPYTFAWNNGATTEDVTGLMAGNYSVLVTDANGCTAILSSQITQPQNALNASVQSVTNADCFGNATGIIDITVSGGTTPYTYQWSNGATTEDLQGLLSGSYTITVTDSNGCYSIITATVNQPAAVLSATGSSTNSNCLQNIGGNILLNVNGGTSPYTFQWSNGAATQNLTNVPGGNYTCIITDINGCTASQTITVTDVSQLSVNADGPTTFCVGDYVTLIADSIPNATYQWSVNGILLNGATNFWFTTPAAGSYTVTITHPCGTYTSNAVIITVNSVTNVTINNNLIICPPESANLYATGGVTYSWSPVNSLNNASVPDPVATPAATTIYTVTITSLEGCTTTATVEVGVECDSLLIPTGFSPNDDGTNDGYVIDGIEGYPGNKLWIYNRWGNLVFKQKDYDNKWNGTCNISGVQFGEKLPTGTYFFLLDLNNNSKPVSGYLILRR